MFSSKDFEKCWFCSETPQKALCSSIDEMRKNHKESQSYIKNLLKQIAELTEKLDKALSTIGNLEKKISDYDSRNDLNNQRLLGSRSKT